MCTKLSQQEVEELRADVNRSNINKAEAQAIMELKGDKDRLVLTADKGVVMVVMNRQDYINKSNSSQTHPEGSH